ncbi:uncharacterized protein LOC143880998 [Tasmannia lanceolata]|uniref:uncharacterized protein LOC143880998 n=1 Tax=Tasmannia lanceolata TaxID=3420 RepID=UPI00406436BB
MDSSRLPQKHSENSFPIGRKPSTRRTKSFCCSFPSHYPSFQSSSSFSSNIESPLSPNSPLLFYGIPFSWEKQPGIPKKTQFPSPNQNPSIDLLPLPPSKKKTHVTTTVGIDPFVAALMECSKDPWLEPAKVSRSTSDRFGFVDLYGSCKKTCSVSESIVYLPRSSRTTSSYPFNRRSD